MAVETVHRAVLLTEAYEAWGSCVVSDADGDLLLVEEGATLRLTIGGEVADRAIPYATSLMGDRHVGLVETLAPLTPTSKFQVGDVVWFDYYGNHGVGRVVNVEDGYDLVVIAAATGNSQYASAGQCIACGGGELRALTAVADVPGVERYDAADGPWVVVAESLGADEYGPEISRADAGEVARLRYRDYVHLKIRDEGGWADVGDCYYLTDEQAAALTRVRDSKFVAGDVVWFADAGNCGVGPISYIRKIAEDSYGLNVIAAPLDNSLFTPRFAGDELTPPTSEDNDTTPTPAKGPGGRGKKVGEDSRQRKVTLDEAMWRAIGERAERDRVSRGEVIRQAIAAHLYR